MKGFDKNKKYFDHLIKSGDLSHAYLFFGPDQIGKRTFALELADKITDSKGDFKQDVLIISAINSDSGASISVDDVRSILSFVSMRSFNGTSRVVIIDDAHRLTESAQNALLKILEEPNPSSVFILVTSHPDGMASTIISRCQSVEFSVHSRSVFADALKDYKLSDEQISFLYEFTSGAIGLALQLIDKDGMKIMKSYLSDFNDLLKMKLHEKLSKAQEYANIESTSEVISMVLYWMRYLNANMLERPVFSKLLRPVQNLYMLILQPQFNKQMAFEHFMIDFHNNLSANV